MASIELSQGTIRYREEGAGEPLLFVHGLLVDGRLWQELTPHLAARWRCIVPDWPLGAHRSALRPGADRSPRGIARLVGELIERLELDRVTVVANDTGGAISQILAAERPPRMRGLVLTNCDCLENFLPPAFRPLQWLARVPGAYAAVAEAGRLAALRRSALGFGMLSHRRLPDELTGSWLEPLRTPAIRADMVATLRGIDRRDTLAAASALAERPLPMLLAWGADDPFFRLRFARRLAEMVPGARLVEVQGSRTFVPIDQPGRLAGLIDEFLQGEGERSHREGRLSVP
jgi:pimeloyl-ACP methyl ester carboxylesterase